MEKCLKIVFPTNTSSKLFVPIEENMSLFNLFINLAFKEKFFYDFVKSGGNSDEGPILMIYNGRHINFKDLDCIYVNPGDELYFIPPILGG
jgi:hypothetical protein